MAKTQEFITLKDHKDNRRKDFNLELSNKDKTLNKRSELFTKCRHRNKDHKDNFGRSAAIETKTTRTILNLTPNAV